MKPTGAQRGSVAILGVFLLCLAATRIASGWGAGAHQYVAGLAVEELPHSAMRTLYQANLAWIETNSSFPDRWLGRHDLSEPSRHHLFHEAFGAATDMKKIPHRYADAVKLRGYDQLRTDGVLPWTIDRHFRLLVSAWENSEWDDVFFETAMLSHYAADAELPLQTTENGNGELSTPPQTGIRRRFTEGLVERNIRFSDLTAGPPTAVRDSNAWAFAALQAGSLRVPVLLAADKRAAAASSGAYDDAYWHVFAATAGPVAVTSLESASAALSGLLERAWTEAGRPTPPADFIMTDRYVPYAPSAAARDIPGGPAFPVIGPEARDAARQGAHSIKVTSKILKRDVGVTLLLPADYEKTRRRYPVLYLLHGSSGSERDWISKSGIAAYVAGLSLIVVMPDAGDSWYVDSSGQGDYEEFFLKELIPAIDDSLRTLPVRSARGIAGNSMGGYGAWRLGLDRPDLFACAASLSGALDMGVVDPHSGEPNDWITSLYGGTTPSALRKYSRDSLYTRLDRLDIRGHWRGPSLYFDAGSSDYLLSGDHHMEQYLLERNIPYEYAEFDPGEHGWPYWDEHIRDTLQFTLRHLAPPTAF
jgi:S-formylglutathione hydrolase FrmB